MKKSLPKFFGWTVLLLSIFFFSACGFSSEDSSPGLRFAVITDVHVDALQPLSAGAKKPRKPVLKDIRMRFRRLLEALKKEKVDFVVLTGDLVNFLSRANLLIAKDEIARSGLKVFRVPGNHDREILDPSREMTDKTGGSAVPEKTGEWKNIWKNSVENPKSSNFIQKGHAFIFLDDSTGRFNEVSIGRASAFLDQDPDSRAFVFFHKPIKMPNESVRAAERYGKRYGPPFVSGKYDVFPPSPIFPFLERYQRRIEAVFAGHIHSQAKDSWKNQFNQFVLEPGTRTGAYALVDCKNSKGCDISISHAWGASFK